jgi:hypothetical protein
MMTLRSVSLRTAGGFAQAVKKPSAPLAVTGQVIGLSIEKH